MSRPAAALLLLPLGLLASAAPPAGARPWLELNTTAPPGGNARPAAPTALATQPALLPPHRAPLTAPPTPTGFAEPDGREAARPSLGAEQPSGAEQPLGGEQALLSPSGGVLEEGRFWTPRPRRAPTMPALQPTGGWDPLLGRRSHLPKDWLGLQTLAADTPILILAGHADAQGGISPGTSGEAVDRHGAAAMSPGISDELHWTLVVAAAVTELGQQRGLPIRLYVPPSRSIASGDHPATNWSVGRLHTAQGGYALELHFDAYGRAGVGSGLIPPLNRPTSQLDEALARQFGAYPLRFRDGLGGPKRGLALLEIGKLEGPLEASLRDPSRRDATVAAISARIVAALEEGLGRTPGLPETGSGGLVGVLATP